MFSNLDDFLNESKDGCKEPENDLQNTSAANVNDSWDLDLSMPDKKASKKTDDKNSKNVPFVPVKGQKSAAKRLQKINEKLTKNLEEVERQHKKTESSLESKSKNKSPSKRTTSNLRNARQTGSRRRRAYLDSMELDIPTTRTPHDPNTIVLDCDDVFDGVPAVNFTRNLAEATAISAEETAELKVTVRINSKIEQYQMNPFQKLSSLIAQIGQKKSIATDHIALTFDDKTVSEDDTPNAIGYIQGLVMRAHISNMPKNKTTAVGSNNKSNERNQLEIKIQAEGRKRPFTTHIGPTDKLITLAFACAEEFKCAIDKVALEFDGDFINFNETAEDLGLEGGEMMDFFIKK